MSTDAPPPRMLETRAKLSSHFNDFKDEKYGEGWSALWEKGDYLPWDKGFPSPALIDTLAQRHDLLGPVLLSNGKRKKALVPGCGRGVDVLLLASFGYDAYGLEYSEKAVEQCHKLLKEHGDDSMYRPKDQQVGKGDVVFVRGDFYGDEFLEEMGVRGGKFDLIYDYTFFCAMSPAMRPAWALRMSQLLKPPPHGNLICLEFPTYKDASSGGPPFSSPPEVYVAHLSWPGEEIAYGEDGSMKEHGLRSSGGESKKGLERVGHWTPERTHEAGKDGEGNIRDFVAVWRLRS